MYLQNTEFICKIIEIYLLNYINDSTKYCGY